MKIHTQLTARQNKFPGETNPGISQTIPDQATSPQELLRRYATGQPLGFKNVEAVYDDDSDTPIPEFYKMNKLDRLHALQNSTENLIEKRNIHDRMLQQQQIKKAEQAKQKREEENSNATKEQQEKRSDSQSD